MHDESASIARIKTLSARMFRQQYPSTNSEWTSLPYLVNYGTQHLSALRNRQNISPFIGDNRKEIGYTRYPHFPIIRHVCIFPSMQFLCRAGHRLLIQNRQYDAMQA